MEPLISVIVPVYNVEKYLEKCINSIRNQTIEEIEIILINDGSTDSSEKIINKYTEVDKRIVAVHQKNGGQSSARNTGLERAKGKYIAFVDSDDWIDEDMYKKFYQEAQKGYDLIVCGRRVYGEDEKLKIEISVQEEETELCIEESMEDYIYHKFLYPHTVSTGNKFYKKEIIDKLNLRFEDVTYVGTEDTLFNYIYLSNIKKIKTINKIFYNSLAREGSTMRSYNPGYMKRLGNLMEQLEKNTQDNKKEKRLPIIFLYFLQFYSNILKNYINEDIMTNELKEGMEIKAFKKNVSRLAFSKISLESLKRKDYSLKGRLYIKILCLGLHFKAYKTTAKLL